jgi:hypothetical protein
MIEYLAKRQKILVGWGGDHDNWAKKMGNNAYAHFAEEAKAHYMYGLGYVTLNVGNTTYRIAGAHRLPGHSMYNKVHPAMRAEKFGGARGANIIVHGHTHQKGYSAQPVREFGGETRMVHFISVGPYKSDDGYAQKLGLGGLSGDQLFGSAVVLHDDQFRIEYDNDILQANQRIIDLS